MLFLQGLPYSPGYSGSWSLRRRMVTVEKGVVRAGRLQPLGEVRPQELGEGGALTNGPGCSPNACQEQQCPHNDSCHLGSGAAWSRPDTCNRHQAGVTARPMLSTARVGHWASTDREWRVPSRAWPVVPRAPFLGPGSWQGCPTPVAWIDRCLASQVFQLRRGYGWAGCHLPASLPGTGSYSSPVTMHFWTSLFLPASLSPDPLSH